MVGYEGIYKVSTCNRVLSCERILRNGHFWGERFLKLATDKDGYLKIELNHDNVAKHRLLHRLIAIAAIPNPLNLPVVNHDDGNKQNNQLYNLIWSTVIDNNKHADKTGLWNNRGARNCNTKLSEDDVKKIREMLKENNLTIIQIANLYNVYPFTIRCIYDNVTWKWLE